MTARAITIRENGINRSGPDYQKWIDFVVGGGLLKDVPEPFRLDEVCFYASYNAGQSNGLYTSFKTDVLPYIPMDVLYTGFIHGNVGHELSRKDKANPRSHLY